jgi:hypothetical protein
VNNQQHHAREQPRHYSEIEDDAKARRRSNGTRKIRFYYRTGAKQHQVDLFLLTKLEALDKVEELCLILRRQAAAIVKITRAVVEPRSVKIFDGPVARVALKTAPNADRAFSRRNRTPDDKPNTSVADPPWPDYLDRDLGESRISDPYASAKVVVKLAIMPETRPTFRQ